MPFFPTDCFRSLDVRFYELEGKFGQEGALAAAESSRAAIDRIESWVHEFEADCDFSRLPGYLYAGTDPQRQVLEKEFESLRRVGVDASWTETFPLEFPIQRVVRVERQAQFHPLAYMRELATRFVAAGGQVFESTQVLEVDDGEPCRIVTERSLISARDVLVLSHVPISNKLAIHTKIAAYRSYAIAISCRAKFPEGLFWDLEDPYHYIRGYQRPTGNLLIVGGEDHKVGQNRNTSDCFRRLEEYARGHFGNGNIEYRWSGQIIEPADGLPFIGKNSGSKHVYVATGFSGNGMTFGTLSGMILSDLLIGVPNKWSALYDATRVKPIARKKNVRPSISLLVEANVRHVAKLFARAPWGRNDLQRFDQTLMRVQVGDFEAILYLRCEWRASCSLTVGVSRCITGAERPKNVLVFTTPTARALG
ncbi:MAG: NAD(P)/FAD-dependent oxidoreductase [Myxococcaceae bacterium]